jgi:hypothetical protein
MSKESATQHSAKETAASAESASLTCAAPVGARLGNQTLQHLLQTRLIQTKLDVSHPGDPLELEADRLARAGADTVQRKCSSCEEEELKVSRVSESGQSGPALDESFENAVHSLQGRGGSPLPKSVHPFVQRLGLDPGSVRVHMDADLARKAEAKAFTHGSDIVFNPAHFAPGTQSGDELIRHECVHVAQQGGGVARKIHRSPAANVIQREPGERCGPYGFDNPHLFGDPMPGGPYVDQKIAIDYEAIAPLSDPMKDFDPAESRAIFTDPRRLEQVYYDASRPIAAFAKRWRAMWWVCTVVESTVWRHGEDQARMLFQLGCLANPVCGPDLAVPLRSYSSHTASGRRLRAVFLRAFIGKMRELNANLQIIKNALMLLGAVLTVEGAIADTAPTVAPPVEPPAVKPVATEPPPAPPTPKPAATAEPAGTKATSPEPAASPRPAAPDPPRHPPSPRPTWKHQQTQQQQTRVPPKNTAEGSLDPHSPEIKQLDEAISESERWNTGTVYELEWRGVPSENIYRVERHVRPPIPGMADYVYRFIVYTLKNGTRLLVDPEFQYFVPGATLEAQELMATGVGARIRAALDKSGPGYIPLTDEVLNRYLEIVTGEVAAPITVDEFMAGAPVLN